MPKSKQTPFEQRRELNHWEIEGIINFLRNQFDEEHVNNNVSYGAKAVHLDFNKGKIRCAFYLIHETDLFAVAIRDNRDNEYFRWSRGQDEWQQIDEFFNHISWKDTIF